MKQNKQNQNNEIILIWREKCSNIWISSYQPKNEDPFYFKIALSGVTSNPWFTVMIHKGDNLVSRQDEKSLEQAKKACTNFLKHMHYRNNIWS